MTDWYSDAREADGRTDEEVMAEIRLRRDAVHAAHAREWCSECVQHGVEQERHRLAGVLAAWALSSGESFRTILPYLDLDYSTAYREGWMAFTNGIFERMNAAEKHGAADALAQIGRKP